MFLLLYNKTDIEPSSGNKLPLFDSNSFVVVNTKQAVFPIVLFYMRCPCHSAEKLLLQKNISGMDPSSAASSLGPQGRLSSHSFCSLLNPYEPRHEKTGFLHMRKQRRRSASR